MRTSALQYLYLQKPISTLVIICAIAILPWIGDDFYTKGEPREAAVSVSMIENGNWILPKAYADEFAYKPPMMHWLIAIFSLPQGHVTEFTSRLPSAIAQLILIGFFLAFFGKRIRFQEAFIASLLLLTCFEIHRAGLTARVDMLLTMFTFLGLMLLYRWENKFELKGLPLLIPLMLSGAVLTKGPVGIILPLFVFFVHLLMLRKYSFKKIFKAILYPAVASMFLPMLWYIAAYRQGGDDFINVMLAENFGRFFHLSETNIGYNLGHEEGVFYNFLTLINGFIPWTLLFVFSLFGAKWKWPHKSLRQILIDAWHYILSMEKIKMFSLTATVCILFFYSIPSSKRSVYLMPAYPFISILLAQYFIYITEHRSKVTRIFAYTLTTLTSIVFIAVILEVTGAIDLNNIVAAHTTKASTLQTVSSITEHLKNIGITSRFILALMAISLVTVLYQATKRINIKILYATILLTFSLNMFIDGIVMKGIKNSTSARPFAEHIQLKYNVKDNVYVMNNLREYGNLYAMNFYMGNCFRNFEKEKPVSGYFLTTDHDLTKITKQYGSTYNFEQLSESERLGDIRSKAVLLKFERK